MGNGELYYDITAMLFTAFNVFFIWLVIYLHREGKREGFPYRADGVVDSYETGLGGMPEPKTCLLYTSPSPRDGTSSRMPSSA